jgi:conjugative transposon TraM protein
MNEKTDLKAEKARQLGKPSRHIFFLILPIPLLVSLGFIGHRQGWIGPSPDTGGSEIGLTLTVPEARVKDLPRDRKYDKTYGEGTLSEVNGIGLTLDDNSNINSRMLSGEESSAVGIEANNPQTADALAEELGVSNNPKAYASSDQFKLSSQMKKNRDWNRSQARQQLYHRSVNSSVDNLYRNPLIEQEEKAEQVRLAREEEQRLRANEKLLELLDKQVEQQGKPSYQPVEFSKGSGAEGQGMIKMVKDEPQHIHEMSPYRRSVAASSGSENGNAFYGLNGRKVRNDRPKRFRGAIRAVVHGEGDGIRVSNGTSVAIRLQEETVLYLDGEPLILPENYLVYGISKISGDRIHITVSTVRLDNNLYPIRLEAYDLDGRMGLYVPDMKMKQQLNSSVVQGTTQMASPGYIVGGSVEQQVGGQLASQGINAALNAGKNHIARKAQHPRALIRPNYQILLRSEKEQTIRKEEEAN